MGLTMELVEFGSRAVRTAVTPNGIREFTVSALGKKAEPGAGNIFSFLWNGALRFGGFLVNDVINILFGGISFSFTALWGLFVNAVGFIWNFDWNESDESLNKKIESGLESLAGQLGFTLGGILGHVFCGVLPTAVIFQFNEALALEIYERLGEQALGEVAGNLSVLIQQGAQLAGQALLTYAYTNIRSFIRGGSDEKFKKGLIAKGIIKKEDIDKALEQRNKPWSFAKEFNKLIDKIPNKTLKEMVQQGIQGAVQACIEDGYVIAGGLDHHLAAAHTANKHILGPEQTVSVQLHRNQSGASATSTTLPNSTKATGSTSSGTGNK